MKKLLFLILVCGCKDSELREDYRFRMNAIERRIANLECKNRGSKLGCQETENKLTADETRDAVKSIKDLQNEIIADRAAGMKLCPICPGSISTQILNECSEPCEKKCHNEIVEFEARDNKAKDEKTEDKSGCRPCPKILSTPCYNECRKNCVIKEEERMRELLLKMELEE